MNIRIVTASAGTGKTTRLAQLLDEAIGQESARPGAILATTFTKQAAAELLNRARTRLLQNGRGMQAQALLAARIGTVNAVCGSLVTEFAFELGLSPELRVLDEAGAELALKRALASVVSDEDSDRLQAFRSKFDSSFDWHYEVKRLIEAARANGLNDARFAESADRSVASLDACLGPIADEGVDLDKDLREAIGTAIQTIAAGADVTKGTKTYQALLASSLTDLNHKRLRWGDWAKLGNEKPTSKSLEHAEPVQTAALRHIAHPRLRGDLHALVRLMFDVAGRGLRAYQEFKRDQGLLDFVDQEVHALDLLSRPQVCDVLKDEIDLVLVDEFQDTSPLQLAIFLRLAELAKQSVWVGDPKQAIYGFRGTDPKLMDAAIESLTSTSHDADLVATAVAAVTASAPVETLGTSYRSRPSLVELTNAVFSQAFARQGMAEERVHTKAKREDSAELGPALSQWPLSCDGRVNKDRLAEAVAAGASSLLREKPVVWDREIESNRPAMAGDLAILCRTNAQCLSVSEALGQLGIASVVARVGLRDSAEAQVVLAGLRLLVDDRDRLAAATLARILEYPEDAASFVERALDKDKQTGITSNTAVQAVLAAGTATRDVHVLGAIDAVIDALELRELCAAWGGHAQRIANLDGLRAHASRYASDCEVDGSPPSIVGFLAHFEELASEQGWGVSRRDTIARVGSDDAVTVSTWHAAKGLEWPIVVLFGLESSRSSEAYGVHVLGDQGQFDIQDPLRGRWIHFWPNPYTTSNQRGPVKDAYAASDAYRHVSSQAEREALRVLYVGWTRARDRLVLAAQDGKLLNGLLGTLTGDDGDLLTDSGSTTAETLETTWAGHQFQLAVRPAQPADPVVTPIKAGTVRCGKAPVDYAPATMAPSSAPPQPATLQEAVRLGQAWPIPGTVDIEALGTAVHAFFGSDDSLRAADTRLDMATALLARYEVASALQPAELVEFADRLWRWVHGTFGADAAVLREWPVGMTLDSGTSLLGTADLVLETRDVVAVIDHKSFGVATAKKRVEQLAGQLGCYADALAKARPGKQLSKWVHMPFDGTVAEVRTAHD